MPDISEKEWEADLIGTAGKPGLARQLGWRTCYHTLRSKGSTSGFPDWVLVRERVIFIELKTEKGHVTPAQAHWIRALLEADAEAYVVRPRHLEEIASVLQARYIIPIGPAIPRLTEELEAILGRPAEEHVPDEPHGEGD